MTDGCREMVNASLTPAAVQPCCLRLARTADRRRGGALEHDVDAGGLAARQRALNGAGQLGGVVDVFAMTAERRDHLVVARRQQLAAVHALAPVVAQLELALGVPAA